MVEVRRSERRGRLHDGRQLKRRRACVKGLECLHDEQREVLAASGRQTGRSTIQAHIMTKLTFMGAARTVTGSKYLLEVAARYRTIECRKWPGAFIATVWWLVTVEALPWAIGLFGGYELTYGSLAGVMVALLAGKGLALAAGKPLIAVNHLEGHALDPDRLAHRRPTSRRLQPEC